MTSALIPALFYVLYAAALGILAGLVYRYEKSWGRYLPMILVAIYYVLVKVFPHRILIEAVRGEPAQAEDWRFVASSLALAVAVFFVARIFRRNIK